MLSKELKERCNIIVDPILPNDFTSYFKEIEIEFIKLYNEKKENPTAVKFYCERLGFDINLILLRENFKILNDKPDLKFIAKQIGYIVLLKIHFTNQLDFWEDWESDYLKLESRAKEVVKLKKVKNTRQQESEKSYKWQGNIDVEIKELYDEMKGRFLSAETTLNHFTAIFKGVSLDKIVSPVKWHEDNASEALFFIKELTKRNVIENNGKIHQRFVKCIAKPDGSEFDGDIKSLYSKSSTDLSESKRIEIQTTVAKYT